MAATKEHKIKAIEFALQYVPGMDDNHSHSILLDMLEKLKNETPAGGAAGESK